jgi:multidrug efflux pump subunit AcrA (membrane-fusion protein)
MGAVSDSFKGLRPWQAGVLVAVLAAAFGATYGVYVLATDSGEAGLSEDEQLYTVQYGDLINQVATNGSVVFPNKEQLSFDYQGTVGAVLVEEGEAVVKGQSLVILDGVTIASLEQAVAQARVSLRNAEEDLADAQAPASALALAQAEAKVSDARLSLRKAQDVLAELVDASSKEIAQAEASVTSAKLALESAEEVLDELTNGAGAEEVSDAQSQVDSANTVLANAVRDLELTRKDWDGRVQSAQDTLNDARNGYQSVFTRWLGIELSDADTAFGPDLLLAAWGVDLDTLFSSSFTPYAPQETIVDDAATPWSEVVVYTWIYLYPGEVASTCSSGVAPSQGACIMQEMDDAWSSYQDAQDSLSTVQTQADKAISTAEAVVTRSEDGLAGAQQTLADLALEPDPLQVESRERQLTLAQLALQEAEEALTELQSGPDPLEEEVKLAQVAVTEADLAAAEEDLGELRDSVDPLVVALREAGLVSAQEELEVALQRLEGATLTAPMAGAVSLVNVEEGQAVTPNTRVAEIVDTTVAEVDGVVDEIDVLFVQVGGQAAVTMDALPGQVLQGAVSAIDAAAQNQQGVVTYPIHIELRVPEGLQMREGLSATASITIREERDVLLVPFQTLYGSFDQPVVKLLRDGSVEEQPVVLGASDGFWTVVVDGLQEGDQIVMESTDAAANQFDASINVFRQIGGGGFGGGGGRAGQGQP